MKHSYIAATAHMSARILPGTTILSDCWKAYSLLVDEGYVHETVNHSIEFVSDAGVHTNTIESCWNSVKKSLPHFGTRKALYDLYFAEYCVHHKYLEQAPDKFFEFMHLIATVYRPPTQETTPTAVTSSGLLLDPGVD